MVSKDLPSPPKERGRGRGYLLEFAIQLRSPQTPWEQKLWRYLRANRFHGLKFKRQVPIGPYIVDFSCYQKRLIIELDGGGHASPEQREQDRERDRYLKALGYRVIRFWNSEIDNNLEGVLETIYSVARRPLS